MLNIKKNIDEINFYVGLNRDVFIKEINSNSSFEFYDKYLIELMPREFIDFSNFLIDYILNDSIEDNHPLSILLNYMYGYEVMNSSENKLPDFSSIVQRVNALKENHIQERIKKENESLKKEIKTNGELRSKNERL
ncbi:hypothetical protein PO369_22355 [Phytobacter diazotrophicus]|uniref:hypothetical protein n=1 Tax=Phytobacter diazotrophicus TaxID=395631 RepID=UPI002FFAC7F9